MDYKKLDYRGYTFRVYADGSVEREARIVRCKNRSDSRMLEKIAIQAKDASEYIGMLLKDDK